MCAGEQFVGGMGTGLVDNWKSPVTQKFYDQKCRPPNFEIGKRVFLYKPAENTGEVQKFARPFRRFCWVRELEHTHR